MKDAVNSKPLLEAMPTIVERFRQAHLGVQDFTDMGCLQTVGLVDPALSGYKHCCWGSLVLSELSAVAQGQRNMSTNASPNSLGEPES